MTQGSYRQFCPVAMAAEVLCRRWTIVLLRELVAGSTRFNDLRRGVPRMSPALLSQRLRELETSGILYRKRSPADPDVFEYCLTDAGRELRPIVEAFGMWGQRFVDAELSHPNMLRFAVLGCGPCVPVDLGRLRSTCWRCSRNREQRGRCNLYPSGRLLAKGP